MKKYYKFTIELRYGAVTDYIEFEGDWATRQVRYCDGKWQNAVISDADGVRSMSICDQPLSEISISANNHIDVDKFNWAWNQAQQRVAA
jgi:hypothetical protein